MNEPKKELTFGRLVNFICQIHDQMATQASNAVYISLTLRNWAIGFYIQEYGQNAADRAKYGTRLLDKLSSQLSETGMDGVTARSLRQYRQFYLTYPRIWQTPSAKSLQSLIPISIRQTLSANSFSNSDAANSQTVPTTPAQFGIPAAELIQKLSFSHFTELIAMDDDLKRTFYEIECIHGNWSVRELKRQDHLLNSLVQASGDI
jgi:DUF1016 N-terminal domain